MSLGARFALLPLLVLSACPPTAQVPDGGIGTVVDAGGTTQTFDGHCIRGQVGTEALERYLVGEGGSSKVKFVITEFQSDPARAVWFLDGRFYALHDEWYWFHLLNGHAIPGLGVAPVAGLRFGTVAEVVVWARGKPSLPLDLSWVEGGARLYSPAFYDLALRQLRVLGVGAVVRFPARTSPPVRPELWLFELEYGDRISHPDLVRYFQALEASLPGDVGPRLQWVVRSPGQQALADEMKAGRLAYWDRVTRYQDLAIPGEVEVYGAGITAGIPRRIRSGESMGTGRSDDLLVLEEVPDWLPPASGLVTAVPQTALAHIALLARNRGIPNAYLGGALDRPDLEQLERANAPALMYAVAPDQLTLRPITWAQYSTWKQLRAAPPLVVTAVDTTSAPYVVELASLTAAQAEAQRPLLGGKSVGLSVLVRALPDARASLSAPHAPLAVTARAYVEHLAPLRPTLQSLLADTAFAGNEQARYLALEGTAAYDLRYPGAEALAYRQRLVAGRPQDDALASVVARGGVREELRAQAMPAAALGAIREELVARYGAYAPGQALRFRSSSNIEDAQGFNGAGLYDSASGYLAPEAHPDSKERKKTVEWALKKTWASYWSAEAFEERRAVGAAHLDGAMAVSVHAEFDDAFEAANGVLTVTLRRDGGRPRLRLDANSHPGSESVTNPEAPGALPEVVVVERAEVSSAPVITRVRPSTLATGPVLSDAELLALEEALGRIASDWLDAENAGLDAARAKRVVTLDLEFRTVKQGWPAVASGQPYPRRLVLKQVRSLDPAVAPGAAALKLLAPQDVLARARRIERHTCLGPALQTSAIEVFTDPNLAPDLGHATLPLLASLVVITAAEVPELGLPKGRRVDLDHTRLTHVARPAASGWSLDAGLSTDAAASAGFEQVELRESGEWRLARGAAVVSGAGLQCTTTILFTTPTDYLLSLLE